MLFNSCVISQPLAPSCCCCSYFVARLAGVSLSVDEIAVTAAAQIHKLGVVLEEVNKRLGLTDDALAKWNVQRESCPLSVLYVIQMLKQIGHETVQYTHFFFSPSKHLSAKLAYFKCTIVTTQIPLLWKQNVLKCNTKVILKSKPK